ncbi:hypothetical protein DFH08DRAFT_676432, partial [Mycena albidolilacea]
GSKEWTRQRKDNHKEVERRRHGNINEGINELGRIVPSGSVEKAKGAILSRAIQYIRHLKEKEVRNMEKWTLEKLLVDQVMGDLQVQLDKISRMWEEERAQRQRTEQELEALRGGKASASGTVVGSSPVLRAGRRATARGRGRGDFFLSRLVFFSLLFLYDQRVYFASMSNVPIQVPGGVPSFCDQRV